MFPYDPVLLAAASKEPQTVPDVLNTMQTIAATCEDGDGLKWFNWLYMSVTQAVEDRINAGGFHDPAWLAALDVQFAMLYFNALKASLQGQPTPSCWGAMFAARPQVRLTRIQLAISGINAHINHDLAIALVNTCQASDCSPDRTGQNYADYTNLNVTLDSLIDEAKHELNVRLLGEVLPPVNHLEDLIGAFVVAKAREQAWRSAEVLWHLQAAPPVASVFLTSLDSVTTLASKALLVPVP